MPRLVSDTGSALRVRLLQLGGTLATPVGPLLEVPGPVSIVQVPLPEVDRESQFELRMETRGAGGSWLPAGRVALRLYPRDLLAPLRSWAATRTLRVVEDDDRLGALLRNFEIPFQSRSAAPAAARSGGRVTLYAGRRALDRDWERSDGSAVIFAERERGVPHLVVRETPAGRRVHVEIELLARLVSDPRAQQTFLEIFELLEPDSRS